LKGRIPKSTRRLFGFGPFRLYVAEREVFRAGEPVAVTPKAIDALLVLVSHHGHVVDKQELMKALWPDSFVEEDSLGSPYDVTSLARLMAKILPATYRRILQRPHGTVDC
jgi:DNA-binding winged helix-turn-helix (wHTH) protein